MGVQMWKRLGKAAAALLYCWDRQGEHLEPASPVCTSRAHPAHGQSTSLYPTAHSYGLADTCRGVLQFSQSWTQLLPLLSRVCAGPSPPFTGTGVMEAGARFLNCPALVFLPDYVFRVASSLWKQQKTDQVQLLLALLPVFPLVLDCVPEHSLQVWGCCYICREYMWPWC